MAIAFTPVDIEARKGLDFTSGDTIRVWSKIEDKGKYRLQAFEGIVLARKHGTGLSATFTVRKVSSGVGVERIFPLFSPLVDKIEVTKHAKTRRSKLYYIRDKAAKEIRRKMKTIVPGKSHITGEPLAEESDPVASEE
jgi:large subunit ribosomal protein L19